MRKSGKIPGRLGMIMVCGFMVFIPFDVQVSTEGIGRFSKTTLKIA